MRTKVKNSIIQIVTHFIALVGIVAILVFQYIRVDKSTPIWIKILVPCLLAVLVLFLINYKFIKERLNRKLIAIETAKELGKKGLTNSIISNLIDMVWIIIPLILLATIFCIGGAFLITTGFVLFELLGMYLFIFLGNVWCDANTRAELSKKEKRAQEKFAEQVAERINNLPNRYE